MTNKEALEFGKMWLEMQDDSKNSSTYRFFVTAIKALEQEPILDKIRAEIFNACSDSYHMPVYKLSCEEIFEIIDKYSAESEE